ncbi:MAG: hypothetical protein E2O39_15920 [Planctomycetota bacterium]|nr:MAG: hypothetical protein E2O39_15920 [Planctomycetota bacterium]
MCTASSGPTSHGNRGTRISAGSQANGPAGPSRSSSLPRGSAGGSTGGSAGGSTGGSTGGSVGGLRSKFQFNTVPGPAGRTTELRVGGATRACGASRSSGVSARPRASATPSGISAGSVASLGVTETGCGAGRGMASDPFGAACIARCARNWMRRIVENG